MLPPHPSRLLAPLVAALVLAALPASAFADNSPLLSGYAGPGSGEQAILGGGLVGGSGGSGGGKDDNNSGASGATGQSLAVKQTTTGSGSASSSGSSSSGSGAPLKSTPDRKKSSSHASSPRTSHTSGTSSSPSTSTPTAKTTARPGAPAVVAYTNTSDQVGSSPLTAGDLLIALFGLLAVVLAAVGLRMVMRGTGGDGPPISQVSVR